MSPWGQDITHVLLSISDLYPACDRTNSPTKQQLPTHYNSKCSEAQMIIWQTSPWLGHCCGPSCNYWKFHNIIRRLGSKITCVISGITDFIRDSQRESIKGWEPFLLLITLNNYKWELWTKLLLHRLQSPAFRELPHLPHSIVTPAVFL